MRLEKRRFELFIRSTNVTKPSYNWCMPFRMFS